MRWGRVVAALLMVVLTACSAAPTEGGVALPDRDRPLRVMPLGDSITEGGNALDGYRDVLRDLLVRQDHLKVEFVGTRRSFGSDMAYEGHSGFRIDQLRAVLDEALTTQQPDVILLHIGSNDVGQAYRLDTAPQRLQELTARICALRPEADLFVASLIPINGLQDRIAAFNAYVPSIVAALQAYGCRAHYVDASSAVPVTRLVDGVHPDREGYAMLAAVWYPRVRAVYSGSSPIVAFAINDDVLFYTGYWRHDVGRPSAYWSDLHVSGNTGDTAIYQYTGSVAVHGTRCASCGMAAISVDGGSEAIIDLYDPSERDQAEIYRSPPGGPGPHTLVVRVTGTSDPASAGTAVMIDRLDFSGW